jgi:hypothetical protein
MPDHAEKSDLLLQEVYERLQVLERRVAALESRSELSRSAPTATFLGSKAKNEKQVETTSAVAVLGKAILAIAGAYLLRAIAESGVVPRRLLLVLAIGYAGAWLVWAARAARKSYFASAIFGITAAFILVPLLWEGTVRFQDLTPGFASAVLVGYVVLSQGLAWRKRLEVIPWIAVITAVGTALALLIATHELGSLTIALLVIALITEAAAWSGRWLSLRALSALGADFAVAVLGMVMTAPEGVPASYRPMSTGEITVLGAALLVIYAGSLGLRGFGMVRKWTFGEVAQAAVAFGLGTWVILRTTRGGAATALGGIFLVLAVACYWGVLKRFTSSGMQRNRRVSANYAAGLMVAGIFLVFGGNPRAVLLSLAAVAAVMLFTRTGELSLGVHGAFYLLAACIVCGLFGYAGRALAGTVPTWPEWSFWVVAAAGSVSYIIGSREKGKGEKTRVLWVVPAAVVGFAVAALVVAGIASLGVVDLSASRVSMVRTVVTSVMALGWGYAGSRWNRVELGWLAYGAIGLGALKLVLEDLRFGNAGTLMVSLLFYGLILILLPKVTRFGRVEI